MRRYLIGLSLLVLLGSGSAILAQPASEDAPLAETAAETFSEAVTDLFGNQVSLHFDLPDNSLTFRDKTGKTSISVIFGPNERSDVMTAYMTASDLANRIREGEKDPGFSLWLGEREVTFKAAKRDGRSWTVLYVSGADGQVARFAVPQLWELKEPKAAHLYGIKSGFERLLIKGGL